MKIVLFGDSITDMGRDKGDNWSSWGYGVGYSHDVSAELKFLDPNKYDIQNRGISGNRTVDLYARIKKDVWNENPDVLSILIGVNDVWHELSHTDGVDIKRFEKIYRMILDDTLERFPKVKLMILEPFILHGKETDDKFDKLSEVKEYAKVVKKIAEDYNAVFIPLQEKFDKLAQKNGAVHYLYDGVHPNLAGGKLIATEWLKAFFEKIDK